MTEWTQLVKQLQEFYKDDKLAIARKLGDIGQITIERATAIVESELGPSDEDKPKLKEQPKRKQVNEQ